MHYQNGIVLVLNPPTGKRSWGDGITWITPLSDESNKIEYTFSPGAQIQIDNYSTKIIDSKTIIIIEMTSLGIVV